MLFPEGSKLHLVCSKESTRPENLHHIYFRNNGYDRKRKKYFGSLESSDGHALVIIEDVEILKTDVEGFISVAIWKAELAIKTSKGTVKHIQLLKNKIILSDGTELPRESVLDDYGVPAVYPKMQQYFPVLSGNEFKLAFDTTLLANAAKAMGDSRIIMTIPHHPSGAVSCVPYSSENIKARSVVMPIRQSN